MTRLIVEADGGSRGNPGPAAYGALVRDSSSGDVLAEAAESVGIATNNVAEYRGLIAGLQLAAELAADALEVRMDSKLVIEQMAGRWKVKHPDMKPLAHQAMRLAPDQTTWHWVPRADNAAADALLNAVLDGGPPVWRIVGELPEAAADRSIEKPDRESPTVLVLRVDGVEDFPRLQPVVDAASARAARDRVLDEHPGTTVRMATDRRSAALLVSWLLTGDAGAADRLELAAGAEIELVWYPNGSGALRRLGV